MKLFKLLSLIVIATSCQLYGMESKNQEFFVPRSSRSLEHQLIAETKNTFDRDVIDVNTAMAMHGTPQQPIVYDEKYETELKDYLYNGLNSEDTQLPMDLVKIIMSYMPFYTVKGKLVKTLQGYKHTIEQLKQLTNGQLASASPAEYAIKIWDQNTGTCLKTFQANVQCLTQLTNGQLAYGSWDNDIKLLDPNTGTCIKILKGHGDIVLCLIQLANGHLASGSYDGTIKIWDLKKSKDECIKTLRSHKGSVNSLIQLFDSRLASGSTDNTIKIWDPTNSDECIKTLEVDDLTCLTQLSNGQIAYASGHCWNSEINLWDPNTEMHIKTLRGHERPVQCLIQLANGKLASCSNDYTIKIWNLTKSELECILTLKGHEDCIKCLIQLLDGRLASGSSDRTIRIWN